MTTSSSLFCRQWGGHFCLKGRFTDGRRSHAALTRLSSEALPALGGLDHPNIAQSFSPASRSRKSDYPRYYHYVTPLHDTRETVSRWQEREKRGAANVSMPSVALEVPSAAGDALMTSDLPRTAGRFPWLGVLFFSAAEAFHHLCLPLCCPQMLVILDAQNSEAKRVHPWMTLLRELLAIAASIASLQIQ